jgi:hypothetical protein
VCSIFGTLLSLVTLPQYRFSFVEFSLTFLTNTWHQITCSFCPRFSCSPLV